MIAAVAGFIALTPLFASNGAQASLPAPLAVRVEGEGYLRFAVEGRVVYAKAAKLEAKGGLLASSGAAILPSISIPSGASGLIIDPSGTVSVSAAGIQTKLGRLLIARFPADNVLTVQGGFLISPQRPILGCPGESGFGTIVSSDAPTSKDPIAPAASVPASTQPAAAKPREAKTDASHAVAGGSGLTVRLEPKVELAGPRASLGDIAAFEGPDAAKAAAIDIGQIPPAGIPLLVTNARVLGLLLGAGFKKQDVTFATTAAAEIRRTTQHVTQAQFVEAAVKFAGSSLGNPGAWSSEDVGIDFLAPTGTLDLRCKDLKPLGSTATVAVEVVVSGRHINSRTVHLSCSAPLQEGVKAGSSVKVRFSINGIVAEVQGRAKASGYVGQSVDVLVALTPGEAPTTHTGTITAPGQVEVKL